MLEFEPAVSGCSSSHLRSQYLAGHFSCAPYSSIYIPVSYCSPESRGHHGTNLLRHNFKFGLLPILVSRFQCCDVIFRPRPQPFAQSLVPHLQRWYVVGTTQPALKLSRDILPRQILLMLEPQQQLIFVGELRLRSVGSSRNLRRLIRAVRSLALGRSGGFAVVVCP
jgi:hypothetical protein